MSDSFSIQYDVSRRTFKIENQRKQTLDSLELKL